MTEIDNARIVSLSAQLAAETTRANKAEELSARLKLEAQCHAGEARTANSTIYEIYQVLSSGKGEPGNWHGAEPAREYVRAAEANLLTATKAREDDESKFWLVVREPREVPFRKGPWRLAHLASVLREFMEAAPTAYIDVITMGHDGPQVQHGPEALQMADGRSMSVGRKHNARVEAAEEAIRALSPESKDKGNG